MSIADKFNKNKTVYSFEIFPPKITSDISVIYKTLEDLKDLSPDYVSITYSAGGSKNCRTVELANLVKEKYKIDSLAHITCINSTKQEVLDTLQKFKDNNISNLLALRGDKINGLDVGDFKYAVDLIEFIKSHGDFNISGACYPEGHPECESLEKDVKNLKLKVDAGVTHLNSQMFFDNEDFFKFKELCLKENISVPIQAGIMPMVRASQIDRTVTMAGVKIPSKISRMFAKFRDNPESLMEAGIAYATEQIVDLISAGVDGVHLYVMNNSYVAKKITNNITNLLKG